MNNGTYVKFSQLFAKASFIPLWGFVAGIFAIRYGRKANYSKSAKIAIFGLVFNILLATVAISTAFHNQQFASRLYPAVIGSLIFLGLSILAGYIIGLALKKTIR